RASTRACCAHPPGRTRSRTARHGPSATRQSLGWQRRPARHSSRWARNHRGRRFYSCRHPSFSSQPPLGSDLQDEPRGLFVAVAQLIEAKRILLRLLARSEDDAVLRRFAAYRIGVGGVAGEHEGLAAAAAKILLLLIATAAGLRHPVVTTKFVEAEGVAPDVLDAVLAHVWKFYRQLSGTVAWQCCAVRGDVEKEVAPATHAGLGALLVIVGGHEDQLAGMVFSGQLVAPLVGDALGPLQLLPARQQAGAVQLGPAIELTGGQLDEIRFQL